MQTESCATIEMNKRDFENTPPPLLLLRSVLPFPSVRHCIAGHKMCGHSVKQKGTRLVSYVGELHNNAHMYYVLCMLKFCK